VIQSDLKNIEALSKNKKLVFVHGDFNILHAGHFRLFEFAASCGDELIVGVHCNGMGNTIVDEKLRLEALKSIEKVNNVFIMHERVEIYIERLKPSVVVKGKEYENIHNPEKKALDSYGGKLIFSSGELQFTPSKVNLDKMDEAIFLDQSFAYLERHAISMDDLSGCVNQFAEKKVIVIGDLIVDEYNDCFPIGMSQEDPTIVVSPLKTHKFLGGAGIVASHAASLGADVEFFTAGENSETLDFAKEKLTEYGVKTNIIHDDTRPITLKQRYRALNKTLLRVNRMKEHNIDLNLMNDLYDQIEAKIKDTDLVIFSDFSYGVLPRKVVSRVIDLCKKNNVIMAADSQTSSQFGDISKFREVDIITPTEKEARMGVNDFKSTLVSIADTLQKELNVDNVYVTLGADGVLIYDALHQENNRFTTDTLRAFNITPVDPAGAGDSFLTCAALAYTTTHNKWLAAYLGQVAAGCQVGQLGNIPLSKEKILEKLIT
jgi:rfaE bifunctional protein kinase chain/domain